MQPDALQAYRDGFRRRQAALDREDADRCRAGQEAARKLAARLRSVWGAKEVYLFGSLAKRLDARSPFLSRSDIDLAAAGLSSPDYFKIYADLDRLSPFPVDLVLLEECSPGLRSVIERDGIRLI